MTGSNSFVEMVPLPSYIRKELLKQNKKIVSINLYLSLFEEIQEISQSANIVLDYLIKLLKSLLEFQPL